MKLNSFLYFVYLSICFLSCNQCNANPNYFDSMRHSLLHHQNIDSLLVNYDTWLPIAIQLNHDSVKQDLESLKNLTSSENNEFGKAIYKIHYAYWYTEKSADYQTGLKLALEAKQIFEKLNATKQIVNTLCRIAFFKLWNEIGQNNKSIDESILNTFLLPAEKLANSTQDAELQSVVYQWIGSYYIVSKQDYVNSLKYYEKGEKLIENNSNSLNLLSNQAGLGIIYAETCDKEHMLQYLTKCEQHQLSASYPYALGNLYRALSNFYIKCQTDNQAALLYARKSLILAQKLNSVEYISLSQKRLYEVYKQMGNEELALQNLEAHKESESKIARNKFEFAYTEYDVQNKEKTIKEQQYKLQQKNAYIIISLLIIALISGFSLLFFKIRRKNQLLNLKAMEIKNQYQIDLAVRATEEDERRRIASNLHDSVVQKLVVAKMNVESKMESETSATRTKLIELLNEATNEIRQLSHTILPISFDEFGLGKAIVEFAHHSSTPTVQIEVFEEGDFLLVPKNVAIITYRIIQECVQNSLKHANAKTISISITLENNHLEVSVEDDGVGFDTQDNAAPNGIGLNEIKKRINQLNGYFKIESRKGEGSIIIFNFSI